MVQYIFSSDDSLRPRDPWSEIEKQSKGISNNDLLVGVLNSFPGLVAVLNPHRQIIFANRKFLDFFGVDSQQQLIGKRPGEALTCQHAAKSEFGCGNSEWCSSCGAFQSIMNCQVNQEENTQECSLTHAVTGQALEFRVKTTPLPLNQQGMMLLYLSDITDELRRRELERIFFHDVMNTAGGVAGMSRLLGQNKATSDEKRQELFNMLCLSAERLIDEISAQRQLSAAENNDLQVRDNIFRTMESLAWVASFYSNSTYCLKCVVEVAPSSADVQLVTDRSLVNRIIGNMVKNAVEAIAPSGTVVIGCTDHGDKVEFWVHNQGYISEENQLHIFQRSFSTKGKGRGLGTHSIKLLGEHYLGGQVCFKTDPEQGTTFSFFLPKKTI